MSESILKYTILTLGPFVPDQTEAWDQLPVEIVDSDLSMAMELVKPSLYCPLPESLCPAGGIEINFRTMKDFTPDGLMENQPFLNDLKQAGLYLDTARKKNYSASAVKEQLGKWPHLPSIDCRTGSATEKTIEKQPSQTDAIDSILSMVDVPGEQSAGGKAAQSVSLQPVAMIERIFRHIFSDPRFRVMESAWRGLQILAKQLSGENRVPIRIELVPATIDTLEETLDNLITTSVSRPPSLVLIDAGFNSSSRDLEVLVDLAEFGNTLLTPVISWVSPEFFHIRDWSELDRLAYLPNHLETQAYAKWKKLQQTPSARWLALGCNHFAGRYAYGKDFGSGKMSVVEEEPVWIAPVWAIASFFVQAVNHYGWPFAFDDYRKQRLDDLALDTRRPGKPKAVETLFDDERFEQLHRAGFIALRSLKDSVFITHDTMVSQDVTLGYQSLVSRFAQLVLTARDQMDQETPAERIGRDLSHILGRLFEMQGTRGRDSLRVDVEEPDHHGKIPVRVHWHPSGELPSFRERDLRLDFFW